MRLTSANQAIIPLSMRSVFSRKPIASAKRRTARGLTIAVARPAPHSMAKVSRSYPPVASSATKPTWCSLQNAINSVIPAPLLVKRRIAPSRPSRTSSAAEQTSTPQIRSVTVTCLVHAIDNRATVRSCVTLQQAVPRLTSGCCQRGNGRRTPRTGSGGHLTPCSAAPITLRRRLLDTRPQGSLQTSQQQHRGIGYIAPSLGRKGIPSAARDCLLVLKPSDGIPTEPGNIIPGYGSHEIGIIALHLYVTVQNGAMFPLLEYFSPRSRYAVRAAYGGEIVPPNSGVLRS